MGIYETRQNIVRSWNYPGHWTRQGLADTVAGRKKYQDYLHWLSADQAARKELAFDAMCRGWALGSKDFKNAVLKEGFNKDEYDSPEFEARSRSEANELIWEGLLGCETRSGQRI